MQCTGRLVTARGPMFGVSHRRQQRDRSQRPHRNFRPLGPSTTGKAPKLLPRNNGPNASTSPYARAPEKKKAHLTTLAFSSPSRTRSIVIRLRMNPGVFPTTAPDPNTNISTACRASPPRKPTFHSPLLAHARVEPSLRALRLTHILDPLECHGAFDYIIFDLYISENLSVQSSLLFAMVVLSVVLRLGDSGGWEPVAERGSPGVCRESLRDGIGNGNTIELRIPLIFGGSSVCGAVLRSLHRTLIRSLGFYQICGRTPSCMPSPRE